MTQDTLDRVPKQTHFPENYLINFYKNYLQKKILLKRKRMIKIVDIENYFLKNKKNKKN